MAYAEAAHFENPYRSALDNLTAYNIRSTGARVIDSLSKLRAHGNRLLEQCDDWSRPFMENFNRMNLESAARNLSTLFRVSTNQFLNISHHYGDPFAASAHQYTADIQNQLYVRAGLIKSEPDKAEKTEKYPAKPSPSQTRVRNLFDRVRDIDEILGKWHESKLLQDTKDFFNNFAPGFLGFANYQESF